MTSPPRIVAVQAGYHGSHLPFFQSSLMFCYANTRGDFDTMRKCGTKDPEVYRMGIMQLLAVMNVDRVLIAKQIE